MTQIKVTEYKKTIDSGRFEQVMEALHALMKRDDSYVLSSLETLPLCAAERLECGGEKYHLDEGLGVSEDKQKGLINTVDYDAINNMRPIIGEDPPTALSGDEVCTRLFDEEGRMHEDAAAIIRASQLKVPAHLREHTPGGIWAEYVKENHTRISFINPLDMTDPDTIKYEYSQRNKPENWRTFSMPARGEEQMGC